MGHAKMDRLLDTGHPDVDGIFDAGTHAIVDRENFIAEQIRNFDTGAERKNIRSCDAIRDAAAVRRDKRGVVGFVGDTRVGRHALTEHRNDIVCGVVDWLGEWGHRDRGSAGCAGCGPGGENDAARRDRLRLGEQYCRTDVVGQGSRYDRNCSDFLHNSRRGLAAVNLDFLVLSNKKRPLGHIP